MRALAIAVAEEVVLTRRLVEGYQIRQGGFASLGKVRYACDSCRVRAFVIGDPFFILVKLVDIVFRTAVAVVNVGA